MANTVLAALDAEWIEKLRLPDHYEPSARQSRRNLSGSNLECANLQWAALYEADLSRANLRGADLQFAWLERAGFDGTNLEGVNLTGAIVFSRRLSRSVRAAAVADQGGEGLGPRLLPPSARRELGLPDDHNTDVRNNSTILRS